VTGAGPINNPAEPTTVLLGGADRLRGEPVMRLAAPVRALGGVSLGFQRGKLRVGECPADARAVRGAAPDGMVPAGPRVQLRDFGPFTNYR
jgi:hypothetical protein